MLDHPDKWAHEVLPAQSVFKALKETLVHLDNPAMLALKALRDHLAKLACPDKTDETALLVLPVNLARWVFLAVRALVDSLVLPVCPAPRVTLVIPVKTERMAFPDEMATSVLPALLVTLVLPASLVLPVSKVHAV